MWATKVHRRLGTMSLRMTCAISFYYGNSHTHCGKRLGTIIPWTRRNAKLLYRDAFFYTQNLLHINTFTHRRFHTETFFMHTHTHRRISTQRLLHENTLTHRRFYTQTLLHTYAFTCRCLFTDAHTLSHKRFYTQTLLHTDTDAFPHRPFSTQTLLHTDAFTHKHFYTHTLLHTDAFTRKHFYIQTLLHTDAFTLRHFYTQTLFHTDTFTHRRFYTLLHRDAHKARHHWVTSVANKGAQT